ncbi:MAG: hypothetical protein JST79_04235 [Acidobacteria bacterium]|nr:hypothetical protein [Acidobacteriota bacterium]
MRPFQLYFTGDYLDEQGELVADIGAERLRSSGMVQIDFFKDQSPRPGDATYWDRLYSLEITPEHVAQANGIVIFRPWVKASAFARGAKNLVAIGRAGVGCDKIDAAACTENDVLLFNAPDTLTHSTASAGFTMMLMLAKRVLQQQRLVYTGRWDRQPEFLGDDLIGKTLGIVGLGKTGMEMARLSAPFHMKILAYSPSADPTLAEALGVELVPDLDTVLRSADFLSLHCRLEKKTRGMFGERELKLLKPSAYLINVARGELIQEEVLVRALQERWFAGAGLDVFEHEPLPLNSPLLALDNVILTPHWLPSTRRAARAVRDVIVDNMLRVAQGMVPRNVVNVEVLGRPGFREKLRGFAANQAKN